MIINFKISIFPVVFLTIALFFSKVCAQGFYSADLRKVTDKNSGTKLTKEYIFNFENLNKVFFYHDAKKLKKIDKALNKENYEDLLPILQDYVGNFGIRNFYADTAYLMWKLGQLYELTGQSYKAKSLYRLILKHHRKDVTKIRIYYDSLTVLEKDNWVSLDYYYELVEYRREIDTLWPPRGVFVSMGTEVNSPHPDYAPTIGKDGSVLFFTSKRTANIDYESKIDENIYQSTKYYGFWDFAEPVPDINSKYNEGSTSLSPDGELLCFSRCESPDGYGRCDLYLADRNPEGGWKNIRNMGPGINGQAWESHPSFSLTGDTLFFASDRLGGFGLSDIYYTEKLIDSTWSQAKNLGPVINTRNNEVSPYYHPKHNVLYFSSNGHLVNFGLYDIYKTYRKTPNWTEPQNIGPLVNGEGSEYYFTIDPESKYLYYARAEKENPQDFDLFSFPLPMEAQPTATKTLSGSLTDSAGNPFKGIVSVIDLDEGVEVAPKSLRKDGSFDFNLMDEKKYLLIIQGDEFFRIEQIFYMSGDTTFNVKTESVRNKKIRFKSLKFDESSWDILPSMEKDLLNVLDFLIDNPKFKLKISGHTDSQGNPKTNLKLSQRRASAIKQYLVDMGNIDPKRIGAIGYGSSQPIIKSEETEEDKQLNRRVEFEIIPPI